ncbi:hypothetical protein Dda_1345 [Drechslerella dactyloides]|uniref:Mitochondrial inner membrane protein 1 n=1 Tax=Drechslerella dactyloides TaxID=74499 RepID=A0AAD6J1L8_DREDA|nr:hypothetical protein Dda_1345 [Drechslerella dactyloides]
MLSIQRLARPQTVPSALCRALRDKSSPSLRRRLFSLHRPAATSEATRASTQGRHGLASKVPDHFVQIGRTKDRASRLGIRFLRVSSSPGAGNSASAGQGLRSAKLESNPEEVTTVSSIRPIIETSQAAEHEAGDKGPSLEGGLRHDFVPRPVKPLQSVIRDTFAFKEVPKEVLFFGGAGLVPYVATTACSMYLAWEQGNIAEHGASYYITSETASALLESLEQIQVGFGAVILSFLGAVHWGLEFAAYGGSAPYKRYFLGILAPALAWPTVFMPYDIALLTQFLGFTGMYFADARATTLGWAPRWYMTYRFFLTFIVGACIVVTLISRSAIGVGGEITEGLRERATRSRQSEGLELSRTEYRRLAQRERKEIQAKAEEAKQKAEKELAEKEAEVKRAREAAARAAQN